LQTCTTRVGCSFDDKDGCTLYYNPPVVILRLFRNGEPQNGERCYSFFRIMNSEVILIVTPVFLVIGLGYFLKLIGLAQAGFTFELNRFVYYVALPLLLFYKIGGADFTKSFNGLLLLGLTASTILTAIVSYWYGFLRKFRTEVLGTFSQGAFRGNLVYIGLAIAHNAYGELGLATAGIISGFIVPLFNVLSAIVLSLPHNKSSRIGRPNIWVEQLLRNPLIIASFCGICWSYYKVPFPPVIDQFLLIVTGMSLPLALLSIGASFSLVKIRGDLRVGIEATLFKTLFKPFAAVLLLTLFGVTGYELAIGVLLAGAPTATAAYIMAQHGRGDAELTASIIMLSTLFSIITYSIILSLLY